MAERRSLHRKAAVSSDLADLRAAHGGDAVAFWLLMIPFFDRYGCVPDNPQTLRGLVCPLWDDVDHRTVKKWTDWMVRRRMLVRVTGPAGAKGLRCPSFHAHQAQARLDREAPSPYEPADYLPDSARRTHTTPAKPKTDDLQGTPGVVPEYSRSSPGVLPLKGKEKKGKERKEPPQTPPSRNDADPPTWGRTARRGRPTLAEQIARAEQLVARHTVNGRIVYDPTRDPDPERG
jgi:hypothetical protein